MNSIEFKKEVLNDWSLKFPQLSVYSSTILCMTCDIVVIGLRLLRLPNGMGYRPMFEIYPLWEIKDKSNFEYPNLYCSIENKRGGEFNIRYPLHNYHFEEVVECVHKQVGIFLNTSVSVNRLLDFIDHQDKTDIFLQANDSFHKPLLELELYLAKFADSMVQIKF